MLNLPSLNRRRLLLGLASASAGAAAAAVAVAVTEPVAAEAPYTPENLVLLALGDELPGVVAEREAAYAAYARMVKRWSPKWPVAPDAIATSGYYEPWQERGFRGQLILADGSDYTAPETYGQPRRPQPRQIMSSDFIERQVKSCDSFLKRKRPKHPLSQESIDEANRERAEWVGKLAIARAYEAETAAIREASKYRAVCARVEAADKAMAAFVAKVMAETPVTMAGVLVQAQTLDACGTRDWRTFLTPESWSWRQTLATNLLRIAREAPATHA